MSRAAVAIRRACARASLRAMQCLAAASSLLGLAALSQCRDPAHATGASSPAAAAVAGGSDTATTTTADDARRDGETPATTANDARPRDAGPMICAQDEAHIDGTDSRVGPSECAKTRGAGGDAYSPRRRTIDLDTARTARTGTCWYSGCLPMRVGNAATFDAASCSGHHQYAAYDCAPAPESGTTVPAASPHEYCPAALEFTDPESAEKRLLALDPLMTSKLQRDAGARRCCYGHCSTAGWEGHPRGK
jgi:hypothetical protein